MFFWGGVEIARPIRCICEILLQCPMIDLQQADDTELDALLGSLEDPEMELGLDPNLGEDGEEERILGDRGGPGPSAPMGSLAGGAESATSFKELHRRLTEINGQLEAKGGDDADGKVDGDALFFLGMILSGMWKCLFFCCLPNILK